jgi:hypothetical protein
VLSAYLERLEIGKSSAVKRSAGLFGMHLIRSAYPKRVSYLKANSFLIYRREEPCLLEYNDGTVDGGTRRFTASESFVD